MDYYHGELYQDKGKLRGINFKRWWTSDGYVYWLDWDRPTNHKETLCYGVNEDILIDLRNLGAIKFIIKNSEFFVPTDKQLKEMKKDGWWNEKIFSRPNEPMKLYYFKI